MRKIRKKYKRPRKPYDKERIDFEKELIREYGLKNKKEIWKAESKIKKIRNLAKKLIGAEKEKKEKFLNRLKKIGLIKENSKIDDVLELTSRDLLERRLQTLVFRKKIARTIKQARQLIVHKKIKINNKVVNVPSYLVRREEEEKIEKK